MSSVTKSSSYFTQLYKARNILLETLNHQGYDVSHYNNFSMNELHSMLKNEELDIFLEKSDKKVLVKFYELTGLTSKMLRQTNIDKMIEQYFEVEEKLSSKDDLIIILNDDPNDTIDNIVKHVFENKGIYINVISLKRLQFNVLKHELVPEHVILNDEEKSKFLEKYNIKYLSEIPEISRFDAVSKAVCMRPEQVCKITRPSKTAIEGTYYRICVNK